MQVRHSRSGDLASKAVIPEGEAAVALFGVLFAAHVLVALWASGRALQVGLLLLRRGNVGTDEVRSRPLLEASGERRFRYVGRVPLTSLWSSRLLCGTALLCAAVRLWVTLAGLESCRAAMRWSRDWLLAVIVGEAFCLITWTVLVWVDRRNAPLICVAENVQFGLVNALLGTAVLWWLSAFCAHA